MNLDLALKKLFSLHQFGIKLGLENINGLLYYLGDPQKELTTIHVAGSNGKGSTSSFIASILMEAGYKTGLYTSPHFVRFDERIRINGNEIEDDYIVDFINDLDDYIEKHSPTFFELTTAMAFKYYKESKVDIAVIETGLGGRLDATNVINPVASVITSISYEHTNILGEKLEQIAFEKGGIIKNNSKVFLAKLTESARETLIKISSDKKCEVFSLPDFINDENEYLSLKLNDYDYNIYSTPLPGNHQLYNSVLAVLTLNKAMNINNVKNINNGIRNVIKNSGIQGRYERVNFEPMIIFDSAHNPEGVEVFVNEFKNEYAQYEDTILLIAIKGDKAVKKMLELLKPYFNKMMVSSFEHERAYTIDELNQVADELNINNERCQYPVQYIDEFRRERNNKCLAVLGSMYFLGEIKEQIKLEKKP